MQKRSSKKDERFETLANPNLSLNNPSPPRNAIHRQNTLNYFRLEKAFLQLPRIMPIHNSIKPKRYIDCQPFAQDRLNLVGMRYQRRLSKDKNHFQHSTDLVQRKADRHGERIDSHKQIFMENLMMGNGIARIAFESRQKIRVFIEEGNNSRLVNELMRRRGGLKVVASKKEANIVWTPFCDWESANESSVFTEDDRKDQETSTAFTEHIDTPAPSVQDSESRPKPKRLRELTVQRLRLHNHHKNHHELSDKKCLFKNIKRYCKAEKMDEHEVIPKTYHIDGNTSDLPEDICEKQSIWIVKPGEDTNRGTGVSVQQGRENILSAIKQLAAFGKSALVQEYIDPLLYRNRKFDLRCYALITSYCGTLHAYWYKEGYIRTCCREFSYDPQNVYGHLTNDAVQKKHRDYGRYEQCNKLSFADLEVLLRSREMSYSDVLVRMRELAYISIKSAEDKLRGERNMFAFEIFGYDFLIDSKGKVWLIEINTNPCLQFSGSLLSRVIWHMVDNSLGIAVDPLLQGLLEGGWRQRERQNDENKFQLII